VTDISEEIIIGCARQEKWCQKAVYEQYYKKMFAICLRYSSSPDEARDLLHDGFIKLFDRISQFKDYSRFEAWMHKLFANHCIDYVRSAYKRNITYNSDLVGEDLQAEAVEDHEESGIADISTEKLFSAMAQLRPDYRLILNMYAIEKLSHQEIADKLGIQHSTSRSKLLRARKSLVRIIGKM
jgi:RNA polymerase sigma-70 factor (ECF subfamily)